MEHDTATPTPSRLLLVEDHADTARAMAVLLRQQGYDVTTAAGVADALSMWRAGSFDLLLADLSLPDGDGCQLLRELRARHDARLPAIAVTGHSARPDLDAAAGAGFDLYVVKPFHFPSLLDAIGAVLASHAGPGTSN